MRDDRRRFLVVHNTWAGKANERISRPVLEALRNAGCDLQIHEVTGQDAIGSVLGPASLDDLDAVVAVGGDGTVNAVVRTLLARKDHADGTCRPPIGIVPTGTANVIAHELGLTIRPDAVVETLRNGCPKSCTLARAASDIFIILGTVGFDSHVVDLVSPGLKRRFGKAAYWVQILRQSLLYDFPLIDVEIDGRKHSAAGVAILNGSRYGGDHVVLQRAKLETPGLHVILMRRPGTWNMVRYLATAMRGRLTTLPDVDVVEANELVRVSAPDGLPFQADGHVVGRTPLPVSTVPHAIMLLAPRGAE